MSAYCMQSTFPDTLGNKKIIKHSLEFPPYFLYKNIHIMYFKSRTWEGYLQVCVYISAYVEKHLWILTHLKNQR